MARSGAPRDPGRAGGVVLGGGSGTRLGAEVNKVYLPLAGRPLLSWSLQWIAQVPEISTLVLVVRPEDVTLAEAVLDREAPPPGPRAGGAAGRRWPPPPRVRERCPRPPRAVRGGGRARRRRRARRRAPA